jgi:hypothetical protein
MIQLRSPYLILPQLRLMSSTGTSKPGADPGPVRDLVGSWTSRPGENDAIVELDNYRDRLGSPVAWFGDEDFPRQMRGWDFVEIHRKCLEIRPNVP